MFYPATEPPCHPPRQTACHPCTGHAGGGEGLGQQRNGEEQGLLEKRNMVKRGAGWRRTDFLTLDPLEEEPKLEP